MESSSMPSTLTVGSLRLVPLAVTGRVSVARGATPATRSLPESFSRTCVATSASK
jgi:hypothetical protein